MLRRSPAYYLPLLAAFGVAAACGIAQPRFLNDLGNLMFDSWQRASPRTFDPNGPVRIIAVDEESLAEFGQWPWPRTRLAQATRQLIEKGAAAVVFDIIFSEPDRTSLDTLFPTMPKGPERDAIAERLPQIPTNDHVFAQALAAGPTVIATTLLAAGASRPFQAKAGFAFAGDDPAPFVATFRSAAMPLPILTESAKGIGTTNWLPDRDQVIRRVPLLVQHDDAICPALALEALRVAQNTSTIIVRASNASGETGFGRATGINAIKVGDHEIATGPHADIRPYYTPTQAARFISFRRLERGEVDRKDIEGRIVLVGTTAIGLGDVRATPLDPVVAGVEIQAQIVEALDGNEVLERPDWAPGAEQALALVLFLLVAFALPSVPPIVSALVVLAMVAASAYASFLLFARAHLLIDPAFPSITMVAAYVFGTLLLWRSERLSRRQVRNAFGKFLAPAVVDRLAANPRSLVLGGETRELTVMFSDLRNFASISETLDAQALTHFMNAYLTPMTDAILDEEGTVDKYIGDAIVAFWNAPLDVENHPARAVSAALRMRAALVAFNRDREADMRRLGLTYVPAAIGIGLNLGPCTVGNMGSLRRFDYSILGDTVNLASRLEGASKVYGLDLVASIAVVERTSSFAWLELDWVRVKGRTETTAIFGLAGDGATANSDGFRRWRSAHEAMLDAFRSRDFPEAERSVAKLGNDAPIGWRAYYDDMAQRIADVAHEPHSFEFKTVRVLDGK